VTKKNTSDYRDKKRSEMMQTLSNANGIGNVVRLPVAHRTTGLGRSAIYRSRLTESFKGALDLMSAPLQEWLGSFDREQIR